MPYVKFADRKRLSGAINWNAMVPANAGELNYVISLLVGEYVVRKGLKYQVIAEAQAAMSGALDEFNRRVAGPYEDTAIERNGDIAPYAALVDRIDVIWAEILSEQQDSL